LFDFFGKTTRPATARDRAGQEREDGGTPMAKPRGRRRQEPVEDVETRLARRIKAWAETWRRCPKKACIRHKVCQREAACAGVSPGPVRFTQEEQRTIRAAIDKALGKPERLYEGDGGRSVRHEDG